MAALNEYTTQWKGTPRHSRSANILLTGIKVWKGAIGMAIDGKLQPVVSGAALVAKALTCAGADANGGVVVLARFANVRIIIAAGVSKTLGVSVAYGGGYTDVTLQQATDNGGLVTSTAAAAVAEIRKHGLANSLLRCQFTGDGTGLTAVKTATLVPFAELRGFAATTYDNLGNNADLSIEMEFKTGVAALATKANDVPTRAQIGSRVCLEDDTTCRSSMAPLDMDVELVDVAADGSVYVQIG